MQTPRLSPRTTLLPFAFIAFLAACGGENANGAPPAETAVVDTQHQVVDVSRLGFDEGNQQTAVVEVIEFSDFGCAYCRIFHVETYPSLYEEFVQTGQVVWKYVPVLLGGFRNSLEVTLAAECAGAQGRFAPMRDLLFYQQEEWTRSSDVEALVHRFALEAELEMEQFSACMEEERPLPRMQMADRAVRELGVRGTPTFFVSGQPVQGAVPLDIFREVLREQVSLRTPSTPRE